MQEISLGIQVTVDERSLQGQNFVVRLYNHTTVQRKEAKWSRPKQSSTVVHG